MSIVLPTTTGNATVLEREDYASTGLVCNAAGLLEPTIQKCTALTGNGSTADPLCVRLSTDADNTTVFGTDGGIFTPAGAGGGVTVADTNCIDLTLTAAGELSADPIISPAIGGVDNAITCTATGLYAPVGGVTVADTNCIDLTLTAAGELSAAPILSPAVGGVDNAITCTANGLYAPVGGVTVADTNCIDLTLSAAGQLTADPILSPAVGGVDNAITCTANGLYAPETDPSVVTPAAQCGTLAGRTVATHADGTGAAAQNIEETVTTSVLDANCDVVHTSEDCTETSYKTLPLLINTLDTNLTGIYGSADGAECPTRIVPECGEVLIGGDDGIVRALDVHPVVFRHTAFVFGNVLAEADTDTFVYAAAGPGFLSTNVVALADLPAPPFDPATVGLDCMLWLAKIRIFAQYDLSHVAADPPNKPAYYWGGLRISTPGGLDITQEAFGIDEFDVAGPEAIKQLIKEFRLTGDKVLNQGGTTPFSLEWIHGRNNISGGSTLAISVEIRVEYFLVGV